MIFQDAQAVLFTGDSITDCGRPRPFHVWEVGLGNGYVSQVAALLGAHRPETRLRFINTGISGNRVTDLAARWEEDVLNFQPDWVSVMIGINDVWRQFDRPAITQVSLEQYRSIHEDLVQKTLPKVKGMILMTPFFIELNSEDPMRKLMDAYGAAVREIATRHNTLYVDTQAAFDEFLVHRPSQSLCGDRVHPNDTGHAILARAFLNAVGFEWSRSAK